MNHLDKIVSAGKKIVVGIGLIALASCSGPTYAKRDYDKYPQYRQDIAFHNLGQILSSLCSSRDFWINNKGFNCTQLDINGNYHTTQFQWDEIKTFQCRTAFYLQLDINGLYDSSPIYCAPRERQCDDLKEALEIYLQERKKSN